MKIFAITFLVVIIISCKGVKDESFPSNIHNLKVESVELYKGFITVNDSIHISGNYFRYFPFNDESDLYGDLHVGDLVLNNGNSHKYIDVVKKKTRDTIRYYIYTELIDKKD